MAGASTLFDAALPIARAPPAFSPRNRCSMPWHSGTYAAGEEVVGALVLGILLLAKLLTSSKYKNLNLPPGPRGLPLIGSLHLLGTFPQRDLAKVAETYGPLMSVWLGPRLVVVATSPVAAEEILKTQGANFADRIPTSYSKVVLPGGGGSMQRENKAEARLRKNEKKLEKHRAKYLEVMKNEIAAAHKQAEEKRALAAAKKGQNILKMEEMVAKIRATGIFPKKLGCFAA